MTVVVAGVVGVMLLALVVLVGVALESLLGRRLVTTMRSWEERISSPHRHEHA
jgi:hypothetical protein